MAITPTTTTSGSTAAGATTAANRGAMDKDAFMKLLVAQLKHQDPTSPTDMNGMTAQMTQFSMLEQMTNLAASGAATSGSLARTEALALLGRTATYVDGNGTAHEGLVEHVNVAADKPTLTIAGKTGIDPAKLTSVR